MVVITRNISGGCAFYLARGVRKAIPDGFALAVLVPRAFHLVCGRRHAPQETIWETRAPSITGGHRQAIGRFYSENRRTGCSVETDTTGSCGQRANQKFPAIDHALLSIIPIALSCSSHCTR